jgi:hypothetical protein
MLRTHREQNGGVLVYSRSTLAFCWRRHFIDAPNSFSTKWRCTGLFLQYFGFQMTAPFHRCSELTVNKLAVWEFILSVLRLSVDGAISYMHRTHREQNGGVRIYSRSTFGFPLSAPFHRCFEITWVISTASLNKAVKLCILGSLLPATVTAIHNCAAVTTIFHVVPAANDAFIISLDKLFSVPCW